MKLSHKEAIDFLTKNQEKVICVKLNNNDFFLLKFIDGKLHKVYLTDSLPVIFNEKLKKYIIWYDDFVNSMYQSKFINTKIKYMEGRIK